MPRAQRAYITIFLTAITAFACCSAFALDTAQRAAQRLTVFEIARQESLLCHREDLYQDLSRRIQPEYKASIDALYQEGRAHGLSDQDANYFVIKAAERIRQRVAKDYVPSMRKDKKSICDAIETRFESHTNIILKS